MGILHIDASSRKEGSKTREFSKFIIESLLEKSKQQVIYRDLGQAEGLKFVDEAVVSALFIDNEQRTEEQKQALVPSDQVIKDAMENDIWVFGIPIYNFSVPATFKAWADMLARARVTFKYTENGPEGLLRNKKVIAVIASGGTEIDSEIDFCTPWLRQFMKFVGVTDISIIKADRYSEKKRDEILQSIKSEVEKI